MYTLATAFQAVREEGHRRLAGDPTTWRHGARAGIDRLIRYRQRVISGTWSSADSRWTVQIARGDEGRRADDSCRFQISICAALLPLRRGYTPAFAVIESFAGRGSSTLSTARRSGMGRPSRGAVLGQRRDRDDARARAGPTRCAGYDGARSPTLGVARRPKTRCAALRGIAGSFGCTRYALKQCFWGCHLHALPRTPSA